LSSKRGLVNFFVVSIEKSLPPTPIRNATATSPKGLADVLDHTANGIALASKSGIAATKKLPGEGFKRPWPPLIRMDAAVRKKIDVLFQSR